MLFGRICVCFCLLACGLTAIAQNYWHGDPSIIVPSSAYAAPGYCHTDFLLHNPKYPDKIGGIHPFTSSIPGYYPSDIQTAYNIPNNGGGEAIAIVDAYDDPTALSDFNTFSAQFGLPTEPSGDVTSGGNAVFQVVYQNGSQPGSGVSNNWTQEETLDIEWAHAMAPNAKIYLVEATDNSGTNLYSQAQYAATLPNVKEVSMSWGADEFSTEVSADSTWVASGVAFFASSGDQATQEYPSESVNVVSVGGTSLTSSSGAYGSEVGWAGSGGGPSAYEPIPTFQSCVSSIVGTVRGDPDCSAVADPNTGVAIYSSSYSGWFEIGGTSAACPIVAGITNAREFLMGNFAQSSQDEENRIYNNLMGPFYRDVTSGTTGTYSCATAWDYLTGVGSPYGMLSPWWMPAGNAPGNGEAMGSGALASLRWEDGTFNDPDPEPTIGPDGTIYVGTTNRVLYAMDGATGSMKWGTTLGGAISSSVSYAPNGRLYLSANDAYVYEIDASSGFIDAKYSLDSPSCTPEMGTNGDIYLVTSSGIVHALTANLSSDWSYQLPDGGQTAPPAIGPDGQIYITTSDGDIYAFNQIGTLLWSDEMGFACFDAPVVGNNGLVYMHAGTIYFAFNTSTGNQAWEAFLATTGGGSMAFAVNSSGTPVLYFGNGNSVYAVNAGNGTRIWATVTGEAPMGGVSIGRDGTLYVGEQSLVESFNGLTGAQNWSFNTNNAYVTAPAIGADGTLYLGSLSGNVIAIGASEFASLTAPSSITSATGLTTGTVTLASPAFSGGVTVYFQSSSSNLSVDQDDTIAPGQVQTTFEILASPVSSAETDTITANVNGGTIQTTVTVNPNGLSTFSASPSTVVARYDTTGTIGLSGEAGPSGNTISLSSDTTGVNVPSTVTVPSTQTSTNFYIQTPNVSTPVIATLTATFNGASLQTQITVEPAALSNFYVNPTAVVGNYRSNGVVQLAGPAGPSGNTVSLQSGNAAVTVPASVTVPSGQTGVSFQIATSAVGSQQTATLTASFNGASMQTTLTVNPYGIANFYVSPTSVVGRHASNGVVQLGGPAGSGGVVVSLQSNNSAAGVPSSVTVPQGSTGVSFSISTSSVTSPQTATLTASVGSSSSPATLTVNPVPISNFYASPSAVTGSQSASGVVQLGGAAASGGDVVALSTSSSDATVPATVTVPSGSTGVSFAISTSIVSSSENVTLTATLGPSSMQTTLTLNPYGLSNMYASPTTISSGQSTHIVVQISGPAGPSGNRISLSSDASSVLPVPSSVVVPAGSTGVSFEATGGSPGTAHVTASFNGGSLQATVTVNM